MAIPKGPKIEGENFNLDLKFCIPTFRIPHKKNRGLLGGSLEIFNLD